MYWINVPRRFIRPYSRSLTQSLCAAIAEDASIRDAAGVDRVVAALFFDAKARECNPNLSDVSNRILSSYLDPAQRDEHRSAILDLYGKVIRGRPPVPDDDTNRLVALLKLAGITRSDEGRLRVRNRIYERVFDKAWIEHSMPDAEIRRQRVAFRRGVQRTIAIAGAIVAVMAVLVAFAIRMSIEASRNAMAARSSAADANANSDRAERTAYAANMNLIGHEWDHNNVAHVLELLEETRSFKDRGFEWGYWNRLCHLDLKTVELDTSAVAVSPDGRHIFTVNRDNVVRILDAATGKEMLALTGHTKRINSAAFSQDGNRIVTGSSDNTARVWDVTTGKEMLALTGHTGGVYCGAFSHNGKSVVTGSMDNTAKVWDAVTGRQTVALIGHTSYVPAVAFTPDDTIIITGAEDVTSRTWDASTGKDRKALKGHTIGITSVAFSPDGKRIVTGSYDRTAKVWDALTGKEVLSLKGHSSPINLAAFLSDCKRIVTGSSDNTARFWLSDDRAVSIPVR